MKFKHEFKLNEKEASYVAYKSDDINARIDFISGSAIRVAIYKDGANMLNTYNVAPDNIMPNSGRDRLSLAGFECANIDAKDDGFTLPCGINVSVNTSNFLLTYEKDGKMLFRDRGPLAYNLEKEFGEGTFHYVSRELGEKVFGLGDKAGSVNKAGRSFRIETSDSMGYDATSTDPLYKHVPFYICDNSVSSYGIFYDTSDTSYIDLGKEINNYYEPFKFFQSEDDCLVYYVFFGSKLEILKQFSSLVGRCAFPPYWSFDYCASTMAYTDAPDSQKQLMQFLDKIEELGLNCSGFYLSSGYTSIGDQRCVFNWNYDKFPEPKKLIDEFLKKGIEFIPNIKPAFLDTHPMYDEIAKKGMFVKNPDGTPFITQFWDGYGSYLDFTNPETFDFWKKQVTEKLLDMGMACTWNDNNEFDIKDPEALAGDIKASRIRSSLTYLMNEASYSAQIEKRENLRPFLSTRSGGIGVRRLAQTWSGDNNTSFKDLRYCHYIGLTMSLSGFYFYGHDLGGFYGDMPSRELLLRWIQHGIFEPRMTIHSWNIDGSATMPWSYDDIIPSVKELFKQRKELQPYLYNCAYKAVHNDEPINAPLFLYYDDEEIDVDSPSMMVGRDILATLVLDEDEETVDVYLPQGDDWYLNGHLYEGGQEVGLFIPATSTVPYFKRAGSVIPYGDLSLCVYPLKSGKYESEFFWDDGESFNYEIGSCVNLKITVECDEEKVVVSYVNDGNFNVKPRFIMCSGDDRELMIK